MGYNKVTRVAFLQRDAHSNTQKRNGQKNLIYFSFLLIVSCRSRRSFFSPSQQVKKMFFQYNKIIYVCKCCLRLNAFATTLMRA